MSKEITFTQIDSFNESFYSKHDHLISQRSVMKNGILASSENQQSTVINNPVFSIDLDTGKVANQKQSGRCW
ncbi:MAG: C1 family peptidase, partial [Vagococcus fluvialis]